MKITDTLKLAAEAGVKLPHFTNTNNPIDFPMTSSTLKHTKGDLLKLAEQGEFDIIVQGCNCFCTMGSGIAKQIREQYPDAYEIDALTDAGDYNKLGNYTMVVNDYDDPKFVIVNAYTQYGFNRGGANEDVFEYTSFAMILQKFAHLYKDKRFGFPLIGQGLAGGDPVRIMSMLEDFSRIVTEGGGSVTVVRYEP